MLANRPIATLPLADQDSVNQAGTHGGREGGSPFRRTLHTRRTYPVNRALAHSFMDRNFQPTLTFETAFSGGASLISPATGQFLELWQVDVDAPKDNVATTTVELRDGSSTPIRTVDIAPGSTKTITFGGFPWRIDTSFRVTRPDGSEEVRIAVFYKDREVRV